MAKKLHVGNLAYTVSDESLKTAFSQYGTVKSATVVKDKISGRSKGFGFIEMSSDQEASDAIAKMNSTEFEGRTMFVSESRSTDGPSSGGNRFGNRGGGGFGGGNRSRDDRGGDRRPPRR